MNSADEVAKPLDARGTYKWEDCFHIGIPIPPCSNNGIDTEVTVDDFWPVNVVLYEEA